MSEAFRAVTADVFLDTFDNVFPGGSVLEIRSGEGAGPEREPAGKLLATVKLPAEPWLRSTAGLKAIAREWEGVGVGDGEAGHYRLRDAADTHRVEGVVRKKSADPTLDRVSGALVLDNTNIAPDQAVVIKVFSRGL